MNIGLLFAILSPFFYAVANVIDKFIVDKRVKNIYSYMPVAGFTTVVYVLIFSIFLSWSSISIQQLLFPVITGIINALMFYLYLRLLEKQDVSNIIGFAYIFPIFVAVLSFIFLKEVVSSIGFVGVVMIVIGAVLLSFRFNKKNFKTSIIYVLVYSIVVAIYEFSIKISTNNIPTYNAMVISTFVYGVLTFVILLNSKARKGFKVEIKNLPWAFLSELFACGAVVTLFMAMTRMSATIVASIAAVQPLFILLFEYFITTYIINISFDAKFSHKLISISMIVAGVILLSFA